MMNDEEKIVFEKAKSSLIKLGIYSDEKVKGDKSKISSTELVDSLDSAFIGMNSIFSEARVPHSIPDRNTRIMCMKYRHDLTHAYIGNINEIRNIVSEAFPAFEQYGIIDKNELTFKMMEEVYNNITERNYRHSQEAFNKGIRSLQLWPLEQDPFLNGVWRQHASEYVIVKSILDEIGIDVKEEDVKKIWEERHWELFKRNNPSPISTDER